MSPTKSAAEVKAKDVMTKGVLRVEPEWPAEQLADFLVQHSISGAPVVAEDGELVGVVSLTDLARASTLTQDDLSPDTHDYYVQMLDAYDGEKDLPILASDEGRQTRVSEIMTPVVLSVSADDDVRTVAGKMIDNRVHRLLVTKNRKIEGVITTLDLLKVIRDA